MSEVNWISLLRKVFIFSSFTENQLSLVAKKMKIVPLPKGACLFMENQAGESMGLVLRGTLRVTRKSEDAVRPSSKDITVGFLNRGDTIGEMSLLTGEYHATTSIAETSTEVAVLTKKDFDVLLEKNPTLGVHLSRLLSTRLASIDRGAEANIPAEIFSIIPALPIRDQVVFSINLGLSLVEQTKRKVLLLVVNSSHSLWAKALSTEPIPISRQMIEEGCFDDPKKFNNLIHLHPSGLELLGIDESTFLELGDISNHSVISLVRDFYDYCLLILPCKHEESLLPLLRASKKVAVVTGPHSHPSDIEEIRLIQHSISADKKIDHIWLSAGSDYYLPELVPDFRLTWDLEWGKRFLDTHSPFIPVEAKLAHRTMDRLARWFTNMLIGIALGSGAAFGYALIGILKILEREGIFVDVVAGTSMGALIGSFYAAGKTPDELEEIANGITRLRLLTMADFTFPRAGWIRGNGVLAFLRSYLGDKTFADLQIPFACVATDIQTGREMILDKGNVAECVRASLSLPFFFEPYYMNGRYLVDGGLVNPVPTSVIVSQGANILLSANLTSKAGDRKIPRLMGWRKRLPPILRGPSIPEIMLRTIYTMQYEIAAVRSVLADVVMQVNATDRLWWDLDRAGDIIRQGEISAEESLPKIKSLLPFFSDSCRITLNRRRKRRY